ncbi:MAG: GAF domain-containing sensor histidine kinase [Actinomycetes bacterium]
MTTLADPTGSVMMMRVIDAVSRIMTAGNTSEVLTRLSETAAAIAGCEVVLAMPDSRGQWRDLVSGDSAQAADPASDLVVPFALDDGVLARIVLRGGRADGSEAGTEATRRAVAALATIAGPALRQARQTERLSHQLRKTAAVAALSESLLRSEGAEDVLHTVPDLAVGTLESAMAEVLVRDGDAWLRVQSISHNAPRELAGKRLRVEATPGADVLRTGSTLALDSGASLDAMWPAATRAGTALLTPLRGRSYVHAVLVLARTRADARFTPAEISLIAALAAQVGLALDRATTGDPRLVHALREDRARIARDLHDDVIQRLFGIGLAIDRAVTNTSPVATLAPLVEDVDQVISELRSVITDLRRPPDEQGFAAAIEDVLTGTNAALGWPLAVVAREPLGADVPDHLRHDLLAVLREALSNVVRHARASWAQVTLAVVDGELQLVVADNGVGLSGSRRSGLSNLARRAAEHGGAFTCQGRDGGGTEVAWRVPAGQRSG